ncbi:CoA-transferase family III [Niallia circulans]|jgi:crotonobetainyl-CoA:carnitine CoA-transferase CaiB-like acyl-CoA transferase|uniref:CaiB/BaiF CoA transferase family protein n=1 Tax=Shouchella clausii TaxID=79880 RepID=UPI000BA50223|nr:CoA transferase [Shouchella clausii]SPU17686.1 CoA-transferase family III [Niallia circulans]MBU8595888.1 CoA transferase [Shouchella clausii]MCM3548385.1 CoA transferase [Shouchella clausii]MCY1103068.1 CoA transferase [Shouchella clausii]MEB5478050.1 CoA transferase [Shouchella clausii]
MTTTPLAGINVLDVSTMIAAPFGTALLGDFGADVIKVEMPNRGDTSRSVGPFLDNEPLRWPGLSRNKKSLTLDLHQEAGQDIFKKLAVNADILVENFRPGTLEKWGIGYEVLKELNPNLIMIRVSGYGQTGPYREKAGFGTPATAFSGYTYLQGFPDRHPVSPPFSLTDYICGIYVAFAAVTALYHRDQHQQGSGQMVDIALYETVFRMMEFLVAEYEKLGKVRERSPGLAGHSSPSGTFKTKDGHWIVLVTSTDTTFNRLAKAMGREDLLKDPRYSTNANRLKNNESTNEIVKQWVATLDRERLLEKLDHFGVPVSPVMSIADIYENEHYQARENIVDVKHPRLGTIKVPGIVPKFEKTPGSIRTPAPDLGENNEEILMGLGLSKAEIATLKRENVI